MVKISDLNKNVKNRIIYANNSVLGNIPIGAKLTLQEPQKVLDPSTSITNRTTCGNEEVNLFPTVDVLSKSNS